MSTPPNHESADYAKWFPWFSRRMAEDGSTRSLRWNDGVSRAIWIASMEKDGASGTYQVSIGAHHDRGSQRYVKHGIVADGIGIDELDRMLERARDILASWSEDDLHLAKPGGELSERL